MCPISIYHSACFVICTLNWAEWWHRSSRLHFVYIVVHPSSISVIVVIVGRQRHRTAPIRPTFHILRMVGFILPFSKSNTEIKIQDTRHDQVCICNISALHSPGSSPLNLVEALYSFFAIRNLVRWHAAWARASMSGQVNNNSRRDSRPAPTTNYTNFFKQIAIFRRPRCTRTALNMRRRPCFHSIFIECIPKGKETFS